MPFDEANKGDPFQGDFPARLDETQWGDLAAIVQRQVNDLAQLRNEPAIRHQFLTLLQQRRQPEHPAPQPQQQAPQPQQHAASAREDAVTQFDFLPVDVGFDTLLVPGELLIAAQDYDGQPGAARGPDRYARSFLDGLHMAASEVDCDELHGRVLRLTPTRPTGSQELADAARVLRARGFAVSLTNITPDAAVHKPPPKGSPPPPKGSRLGPAQMAVGQAVLDVSGETAARPQPGDGLGTATKVAIIDTGITSEIRTDGWLDNVPRRDDNIDPLDNFPPPKDGYLDFAAGHGTFVAGIIQQVAPDAEIMVRRAVDSDGIASEVTVACEMIRAVKEDGAQIVNLSLGCQTQDNVPPVAIQAALEIISEWERETGREVLIVAAAGNFADTTPCWPAAFRQVVSVAGLAPDMLPSQWSSRGFWVTCATIGQGLRSTYVEGQESPLVDPVPQHFGPDAWAVWSGTSFAAPQITGALARLHQNDGQPLRQTLRRLLAAGRPIPQFGQALRILPGI
jgi:hypothetical protein